MRKQLVFFGLVAVAVGGCLPAGQSNVQNGGESGASTQAELSPGCANPNFGLSAAAKKLAALPVATNAYARSAAELDATLLGTCQNMGRELGMSPDEIGAGTQGACQTVANRLASESRSLRAEGNLNIRIVAIPPVCEIDADAYARCAADCDVNVQPGQVDIQCEGGQIVGQCSAQCTGECNVGADVQCAGSCEGTCSAGCTGVCHGQCDGQCSSVGADGQCNGTCTGTCHGSCSAGCKGTCQGQCWAHAEAQCHGDCRGGCSVQYERPRCTSDVRPPQVQAECHTACDARFRAEAHCTRGNVDVVVTGDIGVNRDRVERVRRAILAGYGDIEVIRARLHLLQQSGHDLRRAIVGLRGTAGDVGGGAIVCLTEAFAVIPQAIGSVDASMSVSVQVSASVSGSVN